MSYVDASLIATDIIPVVERKDGKRDSSANI